MNWDDDAGQYQEFAEALIDLIGEKRDTQKRRTRLAKARASIDKRDPRYWAAVDLACVDLIERSRISYWIPPSANLPPEASLPPEDRAFDPATA